MHKFHAGVVRSSFVAVLLLSSTSYGAITTMTGTLSEAGPRGLIASGKVRHLGCGVKGEPRVVLIKFTWLRRMVVAMIGFTVLLVGIAMIVLPGPAVAVIPLGLAILATELLWAKRLLQKARATLARKGERKKE